MGTTGTAFGRTVVSGGRLTSAPGRHLLAEVGPVPERSPPPMTLLSHLSAARTAVLTASCLFAFVCVAAGCGDVESGTVQLDPSTEAEREAENAENDRMAEEY